jgi:hypothetical protein
VRLGRAVAAFAVTGGLASGCSSILGLQPPPSEDDGGTTDATTTTVHPGPDAVADAVTEAAPPSDDGGADAEDGGPDDASGVVPCANLDRLDEAGTVYAAFEPDEEGGASPWDSFDLPVHSAFSGGTFDGRYVYFAGRGTVVARYDTTATAASGDAFQSPSSWNEFNVSGFAPGGFEGAVFDGRYVYFIPYEIGTTRTSVVARFDTTASAGDAGASILAGIPASGLSVTSSWATFDLSTLAPDAGTPLSGYWGAGFDGRYIYFVPHNDGAPFGVVVRYDTTTADAGATSGTVHDAGATDAATTDAATTEAGAADAATTEAGAADAGQGVATFGEPGQWQTFDLSTVNPTAVGYAGAVFDGTYMYFVPNANDAFDSELHGGTSGIAARLRTASPFDAGSSWSTFDMTTVNGLLTDFMGGAFDGQFLYMAPRGSGIVGRYNTMGAFTNAPAWSTYDTTRLFPADASAPAFAGAAFDGRFVYFVPAGAGFLSLTRYDTRGLYAQDCAWSRIDLTPFLPADAGAGQYAGAVFDGQYLYLVPDGAFPVLRFAARTPPRQAALPDFNGSFL